MTPILPQVKDCGLHTKVAYGYSNVLHTQLSVVRHFGACNINRTPFTYIAETDELIRDDVLKWWHDNKKQNESKCDGNVQQWTLPVQATKACDGGPKS
jgi:hypothetical protein